MHPIFLTFLLFLPSAHGSVDCRSACHACRAKEYPREMLEIYCAMCQECKERRKDRVKSKIEMAKQQTAVTEQNSLTSENKIQQLAKDNMEYIDPSPVTMETPDEDGDDPSRNNIIQDIPEGCPTPEPCSDDDAPPTTTTTISTITTTRTTTTTTTLRPCPQIKPCKKKTKPPPKPTPCPILPPPLPPPHVYHYPPCALPYALPPPPPIFYPYMYPPAGQAPVPAPAPGAAYAQPLPPEQSVPAPFSRLRQRQPRTTDADYLYMYVGLPKNVVKKG